MRGQRFKRKVLEALFNRYKKYSINWFYTDYLSDDTGVSNRRVGWILKVLHNAKLVDCRSVSTSNYRMWKVVEGVKIEDAERVLFGENIWEETGEYATIK